MMHGLLYTVFLQLALSRLAWASANLPMHEIDALQDLYEGTDGINWNYPAFDPSRMWNFTNPYPCQDSWYGITCSPNTAADGYYHVEQLNMQSYHMEGSLPISFGNLTHLFYLELTLNPLNGAIPETLGWLSKLQYADFSNTELAGPFPDSFAQLSNLQQFYMQTTLLSGSLPEAMCNCSALRILSLDANLLTGTLPACYGGLTNLTQLLISGNSLRGSIPASLGALTNLSYLDLSGGHLTGTLPPTLSGLVSMVHFELGTNKLEGPLPDMFAGWPLLQDVDLQYNDFTGTLPPSLTAAPRLRVLFASSNHLRGPFPAALSAKNTLLQLDIDDNMFTGSLGLQCTTGTQLVAIIANNNYLTGTLPADIAACTAMTEIKLSYNFLNGSIPESLWTTALNNVELDNNHLTGTISADVGNLAGMFFLSLNNNELSGPVPDALFELPLLSVLEVNDNFLTGPLPSGILTSPALAGINIGDNHLTGTLPKNTPTRVLPTLLVGGNALTGTIPSTFTELSLVFFNASANFLTGPLPAAFISGSPRLSFIYLSDNFLTGALPPDWGASTTTSYLYLDSNFFTGPLPPSLGGLLIMQSLNCSWNMLTGSISVTFRNMTKLQVLLLQNNRLQGTIEGAFNVTAQKSLSTIQLSSNQLTGPLPEELFRLPGLNVFAAVSNCFEGSIPLSVCNSTSLSTLALDGLHSASSCRSKIVPAGLQPIVGESVYGINSPLDGGIPTCLFQIPQLVTLHLSGNGITGSLSDALMISPSLQDLSLSHNALTGAVPDIILQRGWTNLDLSFNRFSGTLDAAASVLYKSNASLSIDQNRLSGNIPRALKKPDSVSVLMGNMFACRVDQSDLPDSDSNRARYECGSDTVNNSLFVWIGLLAALLVLALVMRKRGNLVLGHLHLDAQKWLQWSAQNSESVTGGVEEVRGVALHTRALCRLAVVSAAYILFVLGSVFAAATAYYGTYTFQYAWIVSGAFLSGTKAFALMFSFLGVLLVVYYAAAALLVRPLFTSARSCAESSARRPEETKPLLWKRLPWYLLYLSVNFVIVIGVNIAFVLASLHENGHILTFIQILLAVFKVGFNGVFAPIVKSRVQERILRHGGGTAPAEFAAVQLFVALFNNILIPCFVVAIISPSCFYNIFHAADKVTAGYTYSGRCISVSYQDGSIAQCIGEETVHDTTTYTPPFAYSYQCSSSFITYYAPAFVNMCIISAFIVPAMQVITALLHERAAPGTRWFRALHAASSRLVISLPPEEKQTASYKLFDASQLVITLLTYLGLLLTFGALFPPLSLCFAGAMLSVDLWTRLKVGRFLTVATEARRTDLVEELRASCKDIVDGWFLWRSVWTILMVSGLFYTLFLFDTLGDAVGLHKAYWVLIVVPLMPTIGWTAETLLQSAQPRPPAPTSELDRRSSVAADDPRLSEMEARASAIVEMGTVPDGLNDAVTGNPLRRSVF